MRNFKIIGVLLLEKKIFSFYSHGDNHGHVTWTVYINFRSSFLRMLHIKLSFDLPSGFRGEGFEIVDDNGRTDGRTDGRTPKHGHPISSPCESLAQVT